MWPPQLWEESLIRVLKELHNWSLISLHGEFFIKRLREIGQATKPRRIAQMAACVRSETPNLTKTL